MERESVLSILRRAHENLRGHEGNKDLRRKVRKVVSTKVVHVSGLIKKVTDNPEAVEHHEALSILRFSQSPTANSQARFY